MFKKFWISISVIFVSFIAAAWIISAPAFSAPVHSAGPDFPTCSKRQSNFQPRALHSYYINMRDGERIAVDVVLPADTSLKQFPTVLEMTRYWRGADGAPLNSGERTFPQQGYAYVIGDVRGTGASSGLWPYHRSRAETLDFGEVIQWITQQPWSNGKIVGYGLSYSANTADWMAERGEPALKAIVPRFPDYDPYSDLYFPGGIPNRWMADTWGTTVKQMDMNQIRGADGKLLPGVRPVESDKAFLQHALHMRENVPSVYEGFKQVTFRDDKPPTWHGASMQDWAIFSAHERIDSFNVPVQTWGSWFDSGVANGVLHRFATETYPQRAYIGAWTHGGLHSANPFDARNSQPEPPYDAQTNVDLCFIDEATTATEKSWLHPEKLLTYYTIGEDRWKTTTSWPPSGMNMQRWYLEDNHSFGPQKPSAANASDSYRVDFTATTGAFNRWHTNGGVMEVWYGDRAEEDRKLLTYTSDPLPHDVEITGTPEADLFVTVDNNDGAFFVYLEDVDPNGVVRYLTEGELRGIDRKISNGPPPYKADGPYHSYKRADAQPLVPGEMAELKFSMMPISVRVSAGHRIRVALAGADADTFARIPESGDLNVTFHRDQSHASRVILPTQ